MCAQFVKIKSMALRSPSVYHAQIAGTVFKLINLRAKMALRIK